MSPQPHIRGVFESLGTPGLIVVGIVAPLTFGRRRPEVGRSFDTAEPHWSGYAMATVVILLALVIVAAMLA